MEVQRTSDRNLDVTLEMLKTALDKTKTERLKIWDDQFAQLEVEYRNAWTQDIERLTRRHEELRTTAGINPASIERHAAYLQRVQTEDPKTNTQWRMQYDTVRNKIENPESVEDIFKRFSEIAVLLQEIRSSINDLESVQSKQPQRESPNGSIRETLDLIKANVSQEDRGKLLEKLKGLIFKIEGRIEDFNRLYSIYRDPERRLKSEFPSRNIDNHPSHQTGLREVLTYGEDDFRLQLYVWRDDFYISQNVVAQLKAITTSLEGSGNPPTAEALRLKEGVAGQTEEDAETIRLDTRRKIS